MEHDFSIEDIIAIMKKTKKTDPLFKPLKKLKTALESIGMGNVSLEATQRVIVFHFGLGNQLDKQFLQLTSPKALSRNIQIIPGHSYCVLNFEGTQKAAEYMNSKQKINQNPVYFQQLTYQNLKRTLIFLYCSQNFHNQPENFNMPNCSSEYHDTIPGLIVIDDIITKEEELDLLQHIDQGNWERLNNRRVQHFGYQFKYGRNQIDKDQNQGALPKYLDKLLARLYNIPILKGMGFDQLTINDYFAGNGIPSHFDTHSPFEQVFVAVSLLSGIVMDWRKFDGQQQPVYLKQRSVCIFSGQARYAWTHGISCRKVDKVDNEIYYRSRRLSLTFRKIKHTPCKCQYYFYCDSQGYNQQTMKKNNPLLLKYMSQNNTKLLKGLSSVEIQRQYVQKAYNGFGFDFHNKVIDEIKNYIIKQIKQSDFVLDLGCGNGEYAKYMPQGVYYIPVQKCMTMVSVDNEMFMDCKRIGFRSECYEAVILVAVLHHLAGEQNRLKVLSQCFRVLKRGGALYLSVLSFEDKKHIYESPEIMLDYCLPAHKITQKQKLTQTEIKVQVPRIQERGQIYKRYYHLFIAEQLEHLLKISGFVVQELRAVGQNLICKAVKK